MNRIKQIVESLEDWTSGLLIAGGLGILFLQVIMRYIFGLPTTWHDEIARYFIIWGVLIGSTVAIRDNQHIQVDILYNFFPKSLQKWVNLFAHLISLIFFLFMLYYGSQLVIDKWTSGQNSTGEFPLWLIYLILPFSGIMMAIRTLVKIYQIFKNKDASHTEENILL